LPSDYSSPQEIPGFKDGSLEWSFCGLVNINATATRSLLTPAYLLQV